MDALTDILQPAERVPLRLRALYERFGYTRFRMGKFEPYDLYAENRQFLGSEGIITFTDARGRLMALKPDVTISIVKNCSPDAKTQKLYYNENVFRTEGGLNEYREINQIGLEYIGALDGYSEAEVLSLAMDSLSDIGGEYILSISHMGFVAALMGALQIEGEAAERLLMALKQKNSGAVSRIAESSGLSEGEKRALMGVAGVCLELSEGIAIARKYVLSSEMADSLDDLALLDDTLRDAGKSGVYLDFSVVNDIDYYNGLVFRGYVRNAPRAVLAGGRYDNLLRRFGKPQRAIGFAVYLSELERMLHMPREYDADVLLIYGDAPAGTVARAVRELQESFESVRAEREHEPGIKAKKVLILSENGEMEVASYA